MRTILLCAALLTGCATVPTGNIAVPVSCIKGEPPAMPATTQEAEIIAMSDWAATLVIWYERLELKAFAVKAEALLIACKQ